MGVTIVSSRLWKNPPLKPNGCLDYSSLFLPEIFDDLCETLSDLVINGGRADLATLLNELEEGRSDIEQCDIEKQPDTTLVGVMDELIELERKEGGRYRSERSRQLIESAIENIRIAARRAE